MEIHDKYLGKVEEADRQIAKLTRAIQRDPEQEELTDEEIYLKRLEGGLFSLQLVRIG